MYNIYNLIPLPSPVDQNSNIYSYIDSPFPYLLLSTTKTHYSRLKNLRSCQKISPTDYICNHPTLRLTTEHPVCETRLKLTLLDKIPSDCPTKTVQAEMEIWHMLNSNQWLYIMTHPTIGSVSCTNTNHQIIDVNLRGRGIFSMNGQCKCYTPTTVLTSSFNQTVNYTNYIPTIDINHDDCCIKTQEYLKTEPMEPLKLNNLNLNELRHSQHKLQQFDEILQNHLNKPFIVQHAKWYNVALGIIATIILFVALYCFCCRCCNCRWIFKKFWPKQGNDRDCFGICINSHNTVHTRSSSPTTSCELQERPCSSREGDSDNQLMESNASSPRSLQPRRAIAQRPMKI